MRFQVYLHPISPFLTGKIQVLLKMYVHGSEKKIWQNQKIKRTLKGPSLAKLLLEKIIPLLFVCCKKLDKEI
ncbi:hypothetical protein AM500_09235 [Bacillus sp. FJAT-18017]|nr:hypothetical protein AM500_09235 [Bacillus sp. FJAT-18017]